MRIVVAGAGAAGLLASLLLARSGHEVVLVERDRLDPAPDVESAAASAFRATAPQVVQPHMVMARCRNCCSSGCPTCTAGCWPPEQPRRRSGRRCPSRSRSGRSGRMMRG